MTKAEFSDLCASIAHMGLLMPITLFEGRVLDGWQRELACRKTGVPPRYTNFVGDWDGALAFTISYNIRRQHLNESQRAAVAVALSSPPPDEVRAATTGTATAT